MAQVKTVKQRAAVEVVGRGVRRSDNAPVYAVTSASEPGRFRLVVWEIAGSEWQCDCPRWRWRHTCRHVLAVNERVAGERCGIITPKGYAALYAMRAREHGVCAAELERRVDRETAPRRGPQAFSILK